MAPAELLIVVGSAGPCVHHSSSELVSKDARGLSLSSLLDDFFHLPGCWGMPHLGCCVQRLTCGMVVVRVPLCDVPVVLNEAGGTG